MIRPVSADGRIDAGGAFTPVHRQRVVDRISAAAMHRVVLIVAPAGYGKSVALRQYLNECSQASIRYDLHPENATLLGFIRGFAEAIGGVAPDARQTLTGAYEKSTMSKTPASDLAMWMHAHLRAFNGTIAIDDLQLAEGDPQVTKFIVSLIERTKGKTRWAIASRSTLDLPVGSWLAYGEMDLTIDDQDLRFTIDEARQTARASRVSVRDEELNELLSMTEGWPTALSFALRTSTRSVDLRNIAASTREMVYRYLAEQVYENLSADERDLLHFTAYLPEIDLDILRAAGYSNSKGIIESLRDRVSFIYPDRPNVYRCHDLFKEFLHHQLDLSGDAAVAAVRGKVARSFEIAGRPHLALRAYGQAKDQTEVLRLLVRYGFDLMDLGHGDAIAFGVESLPQNVRATDPVVLGIRSMMEAEAGRMDRAESLLQRALSKEITCDLQARLTLRLALLLINLQKDGVTHLDKLLLNPGLTTDQRGEALSLLAVGLAVLDSKARLAGTIAEAKRMLGQIDGDVTRARMLQRIAFAASECSDFEYAHRLFAESAEIATRSGLFSLAARAYSAHANLSLRHDDDIPKTIWLAQQAVNAATKAGDMLPLQTSLLQILDAETKRGNTERTRNVQSQLATVATTDPVRAATVIPSRALAASWEGRFDEAHRLLAVTIDRQAWGADRLLYKAFCALFYATEDKRMDAIRMLDAVAASLGEIGQDADPHMLRHADLAKSISAITETIIGRSTIATRLIQAQPLFVSPTTGAVRQFAACAVRSLRAGEEDGDYACHLEAISDAGYGGYGRTFDAAIKSVLSKRAQADGGSVLTPKETDVLSALAAGRSPKEIASETGRSIYTIQAHIQNIINKLGCSGRHEALAIARKRGILD